MILFRGKSTTKHSSRINIYSKMELTRLIQWVFKEIFFYLFLSFENENLKHYKKLKFNLFLSNFYLSWKNIFLISFLQKNVDYQFEINLEISFIFAKKQIFFLFLSQEISQFSDEEDERNFYFILSKDKSLSR